MTDPGVTVPAVTAGRGGAWRAAAPALVVAFALALAGCGAGVLPGIHNEGERFAVARKLYADHAYSQAIELLKTYVENNAGSADVDEAIYMLGESYLHVKDDVAAQNEFERLLRDYPESDSSASGSFRLGEALYAQARGPDFDQEFTQRALDQWRNYQRSYPGHWLQPTAAKRIAEARDRLAWKLFDTAKLYMKLRLGEPARIYYQRIVDEFGDTPEAGEAAIGVAQADVLAGHKDRAIAWLQELEDRYAGQPIASRAKRERTRLEKQK